MTAKEYFDKIHPKNEYRDDGWVIFYETWREEMIEFAEKYYKHNNIKQD